MCSCDGGAPDGTMTASSDVARGPVAYPPPPGERAHGNGATARDRREWGLQLPTPIPRPAEVRSRRRPLGAVASVRRPGTGWLSAGRLQPARPGPADQRVRCRLAARLGCPTYPFCGTLAAIDGRARGHVRPPGSVDRCERSSPSSDLAAARISCPVSAETSPIPDAAPSRRASTGTALACRARLGSLPRPRCTPVIPCVIQRDPRDLARRRSGIRHGASASIDGRPAAEGPIGADIRGRGGPARHGTRGLTAITFNGERRRRVRPCSAPIPQGGRAHGPPGGRRG